MTRVAILGGGPAGVGAAWRLRHLDRAEVVLVERNETVGGNAGSFEYDGHILDFGSHRLHRACDETILADIRGFLGDDLLDRPRHGRIRLLDQWVHFPLEPLDMVWNVEKSFALGAARDAFAKLLPRRNGSEQDNFASVLRSKLGRTICEHFYFPYARKLWGHEPEQLSAIQARRRVSASSFGKLLKKVLGQLPGLKKPGAGRFFYPRQGFGQISNAYADAARKEGADLWLGWTVTSVERPTEEGRPWRIVARRGDQSRTTEADHLWSTLPITVLSRLLLPAPPPAILANAGAIEYRAMILIYLELDASHFTEYDAHYFPAEDVTITRLSETKNYAARAEPAERTVICAELPCMRGDRHWLMTDEELAALVEADLARSGLHLPGTPRSVTTRRLPQAYPIYEIGYENALDPLQDWVESTPGLLSYGRQGLFAHDNTHHALFMAYSAVDCLVDGTFVTRRWAECREVFATHVVED